ncbi:MAG: hypothetical protein GC159_02035 [Phycisphaera sp.]|nr:hypothetical protein [Phycisphaera sp.]
MCAKRVSTNRLHHPLGAAAVVVVALFTSGCMTLEQMAPPVTTELTAYAQDNGQTLAEGRRIYLTTCAKCHAVEPIGRYSLARWRRIMPDMLDEAKLTGAEADAVTTYVMTARRALDNPAFNAKPGA